MTTYIYVIHFNQPLHHAKHYIGSTASPRERLITHATGHGSALCRHLHANHLRWELAALFASNAKHIKRIERHVKKANNGPRYCPICTADYTIPPGTVSIDLANVPFPIDSTSLAQFSHNTPAEVQTAHAGDERVKEIIIRLGRDNPELGFIPAGGAGGLTTLQDTGRILVAYERSTEPPQETTPVGYLAYTTNQAERTATVHQIAVIDAFRLRGHGTRLIAELSSRYPQYTIKAKVREDLASIGFWFRHSTRIGVGTHKTSGRRFIAFERTPDYVHHPEQQLP